MPSYPGISSEAFRHPLDREAEQALRSLPGFEVAARKFMEFFLERPNYVYFMGNGIQVGPRQYASLYRLFRDCVQDLDITPEPALFVMQNPMANAYALGQEQPSVILNTGVLDLLDEAELRMVFAHELGHVKCGHTTLNQMARWALEAAFFIGDLTFGISNLISRGLVFAFYEWLRKAELSADRAALLVTDDLPLVFKTMMKLAGGSARRLNECSLEEFLRQADRYQALDNDSLNQVYKFLLYNNVAQGTFLTHPFTVERVRYLQEWANSAEYRRIRAGDYAQASAEGAVNTEARPASEADALRRQIEELQREIARRRSQDNSPDDA